MRRCDKGREDLRCAEWPKCGCNYYYREQVKGKRAWVCVEKSGYLAETKAHALAVAQRHEERKIDLGLAPKPKVALPLLSIYIEETYLTADVATKQATFATKLKPNLAEFLAVVKDRPLDEVTEDHVEKYRQHLLTLPSKKTGGTLNRNTVQRRFNSVAGLFAYAAEKIEGFTNPCAKLDEYKQDPAERVLWHPDQLWLIEALAPRFKLPLKIGRLCGCRRAEALALTKHDLSPKGFYFRGTAPRLGWVALQRKKKGGGRVKERIPIALTIVNQLRALLQSPFQLHVFGDPPPNPDAWSSQLRRQLDALGAEHQIDVRGLCMHGTRHTATTLMQDAPGVSSKTAQQMGGWTTPRMVETYSHPAEAALIAAAAGLARSYKPIKPKASKAQKKRA